ncbi:MAG: DUF6198 family protein [Bacillota bacterium]
MKRIRIWGEFGLFLGVLLMAFALALQSKTELGVAMVVTPAYLLSLRFDSITFGMADYSVQFLLLVALAIITRKLTLKFALAFVTSALYGLSLDLMVFLLKGVMPSTLFERIAYFAVGQLLTGLSVALFFRTNLPLMAYDMFVKELAVHKGWAIGKLKIGYDLTILVVSVALAFVLFGAIRGIHIGTFVTAAVTGVLIIGFGKVLDRFIDFTPKFDIVWK